jgi:hypothetical protein
MFIGTLTTTYKTTYGETKTADKIVHRSQNSGQYDYSLDFGGLMRYGRCKTFPTSKGEDKPVQSDYGVYFGSGSTPATREDYKLESPIESGLSITNPSSLVWLETDGGNCSAVADFVLRNTSGAKIVVREVGFVSALIRQNDGDFYPCLFERTVLDNPVTIPAGEAKLIEYKVTVSET